MSDPFLAEIKLFGGNFAPRGWAFCDGQLLPINQYSALFSILGTIYGGDGRTTFALPDLRGRVALGQGQGPGLSSYRQGERGGAETTTLNVLNMPSHNHTATPSGMGVDIPVNTISGDNDEVSPGRGVLANTGNDDYTGKATVGAKYSGQTIPVAGTVTVNNTGGGQSFNNFQPYLAVNYIIALQGMFPSRS